MPELGYVNLLPSYFQGCSLRNTEYIVGAVVFTGHETKVSCREACLITNTNFEKIYWYGKHSGLSPFTDTFMILHPYIVSYI